MKEKDRNLSVLQYLDKLQEEYYICELRKKIYHSVSCKKYYSRVMEFKKEKILDISEKNNLRNIFDDIDIRNKFMRIVYPEFGMPMYPMTGDDLINYFMVGSDVRVEKEDKTYLIGVIVSVDLEKKIVHVKLNQGKGEKPFHIMYLTRIL